MVIEDLNDEYNKYVKRQGSNYIPMPLWLVLQGKNLFNLDKFA